MFSYANVRATVRPLIFLEKLLYYPMHARYQRDLSHTGLIDNLNQSIIRKTKGATHEWLVAQAVAFFGGELDLSPAPSRLEQLFEMYSVYDIDFGDVRGQESAKRAMTLAAVGRHNLIKVEPPSSGKPGDIETFNYDDAVVALPF